MLSSCMGSLMELAERDKNVLYLSADSGEGGLDRMFRMNFPDRAYNFGIAECNTVSAAAGLATAGKMPFVYTAAPFLVYRAYEFVRNDICMQNLNVKLLGTGSGLSVSSLGPTHHSTEDIAALRVLPDLMLLSPATPAQAAACMRLAYEHNGPVYIRLGMNREPELFEAGYPFRPEVSDIMRTGKDICMISTGSIISEAMGAAEILATHGCQAEVINVSMLKPFNAEDVLQKINSFKRIVSIEEHNIAGGLGGILAETLTDAGICAKLFRIGLRDTFSQGYGKLSDIRAENGLNAEGIAGQIREAFL